MCLVLFAYQPGSPTPLVVAANRDEFYARPALSAHYWPAAEDILGGRDLEAGGTWLALSTRGRFAAVTNFAEDAPGEEAPRSRGALTEEFLTGSLSAHDYAHGLHGPDFRGYNLLLWDGSSLVYTSNRGTTQDLAPGTYGIANAELGATWPKVTSGVRALDASLTDGANPERLLALLTDDAVPPDELLPVRGRPIEFERRAAPVFIRGNEYGTRASTAVVVRSNGFDFAEQLFGPGGTVGEINSFSGSLLAG
jgi:uncharacterized protein with NRDE domain